MFIHKYQKGNPWRVVIKLVLKLHGIKKNETMEANQVLFESICYFYKTILISFFIKLSQLISDISRSENHKAK